MAKKEEMKKKPKSDLENEILEAELEEEINKISKEEIIEEQESETPSRFSGSWSMERGSPSLEKVQRQENLEEIEKINPTTKTENKKFMDYSSQTQKNYDVIAEEEFRRYEIAQTGVNAPTLSTIERDFSPRLINPFAERNFTKENIEPKSIETQRTETKKRLPFQKDEKYRR